MEDDKDDRMVFSENELMDIVRNVAGDIVEDVVLIDQFKHPKKGMESLC